jgi:hypothetical protein
MANRYWAGGAGTWDATTTTNWSAALPLALATASCSGTTLTTTGSPALVAGMTVRSSTNVSLGTIVSGSVNTWTVTIGGTYASQSMTAATVGASAPTLADNVFFGTTSSGAAYAVTIGTNAAAADVTIVGATGGTVTITSAATSVLNVYGSWTSAATGVAFSTTSGALLNFLATTTGKTISTNNISIGPMSVFFNGVGGGWTLGSAFTVTSSGTTLTAGSFSTGNFAFNGSGFLSTGTGTRSLTLGSSVITLTGTNVFNFEIATNLTFSGATSAITCSGTNPTFTGGGFTYGTVNLTSTTGGTTSITAANTFTTLTQATVATAGIRIVSLGANQTISGTLTLSNGATSNRRMFVRSDIIGTSRTLTVATLAALVDVDFRDIVAAGASGTWSGTRLGDCKNNSNITFAAPKTVYFSSSAGASANWIGAVWATSSGGSDFSTNNFPLAQDTIYIDNAGATTGDGLRTDGVITFSANWNIGNLISTRTAAYSLNQGNNDPTVYGDFTLSSGISFTVLTSPTWTFSGQGITQNITTAGKTMTFTNVFVDSPGGTVKLLDSWTSAIPSGATAATFSLTAGTLDINGFTLTANAFGNSNNNTRTLAFGTTGKIVLAGNSGTVYSSASDTGLSVTGTSPLVQFTYSGGTGSRNITMSGLTESQSISVEFLNNATDTVVIQGTSGAYRNIDFTNFNGTVTTANSPRVYGNLTLGTNVLTNAFAGTSLNFASTSGTKTITSNGIAFDVSIGFIGVGGTWQLVGNLTNGSTRTVTLTNGTLDLNIYTLTSGLFSSLNSNTRTLAFGAGKIVVTGNSGTVWQTQDHTGMTVTGTSRVELYYTGATGTRSISSGFTAGTEANSINFYVTGNGTDIVSFLGTGRTYGTIDVSQFAGYWQSDNYAYTIYGNLVLSSAILGITTSSTFEGPITFGSTSGTKTITSAGKTMDFPIAFNGVGGTWQLQDALTIGSTHTTTLVNGTLNLNGMTAILGLNFNSTGTGTRTLSWANAGAALFRGSWTVSGTNFTTTLNASVSQGGIQTLGSGPFTFTGGGYNYPYLYAGGSATTTVSNNNQFNGFSITAGSTLKLPSSGTTTVLDNVVSQGVSGNLSVLNASTPGTQATLAIPNGLRISQDYISLQDINISTNNGLFHVKPNSTVETNVTGVSTALGEFLSFF